VHILSPGDQGFWFAVLWCISGKKSKANLAARLWMRRGNREHPETADEPVRVVLSSGVN